jgi:hypothetical protein
VICWILREISQGGVGERLKPAVLKNKTVVRYLSENSTTSLCEPPDSENPHFWICSVFAHFCATFTDNLLTVARFDSRT